MADRSRAANRSSTIVAAATASFSLLARGEPFSSRRASESLFRPVIFWAILSCSSVQGVDGGLGSGVVAWVAAAEKMDAADSSMILKAGSIVVLAVESLG